MLNIKKKLGSLVPSDNVRSQLQNALTVEWAGGDKTVLYEVPTTGRSADVEMSGMSGGGAIGGGGRKRSAYGRLPDDDDQWDSPSPTYVAASVDHFVRPRIERAPASFAAGSSGSKRRTKQVPHALDALDHLDLEQDTRRRSTLRSNNPFANPFSHEDDFAPAVVGEGFAPTRRPPQGASPASSRAPSPGVPPRPDSRQLRKHAQDLSPWPWDESATKSPTSSTSTTESSRRDRNPFRQ